jgi:hypothetical protein
MHDTQVSYRQLDCVMLSLGFRVQVEKGKYRLYTHEATGALMTLPDRKLTELVSPMHLAGVRTVLANFGIADEFEFASQLQKAS